MCKKIRTVNNSIESKIQKCEKLLKEAMLQSNVSELNKLLADDLIFTNHLGRVMNKQDDLEAHRSKILNINEITLNDMKIKLYSGIAIVTVKAHIIGSFNGEISENDFRFTRIWSEVSSGTWQIISGHSSLVA